MAPCGIGDPLPCSLGPRGCGTRLDCGRGRQRHSAERRVAAEVRALANVFMWRSLRNVPGKLGWIGSRSSATGPGRSCPQRPLRHVEQCLRVQRTAEPAGRQVLDAHESLPRAIEVRGHQVAVVQVEYEPAECAANSSSTCARAGLRAGTRSATKPGERLAVRDAGLSTRIERTLLLVEQRDTAMRHLRRRRVARERQAGLARGHDRSRANGDRSAASVKMPPLRSRPEYTLPSGSRWSAAPVVKRP